MFDDLLLKRVAAVIGTQCNHFVFLLNPYKFRFPLPENRHISKADGLKERIARRDILPHVFRKMGVTPTVIIFPEAFIKPQMGSSGKKPRPSRTPEVLSSMPFPFRMIVLSSVPILSPQRDKSSRVSKPYFDI